jgi:hypothetical protein
MDIFPDMMLNQNGLRIYGKNIKGRGMQMEKKQVDINEIHEKIQQIKQLLGELQQDMEVFPAINRNSKRALASLKMLELNISDMVAFGLVDTL